MTGSTRGAGKAVTDQRRSAKEERGVVFQVYTEAACRGALNKETLLNRSLSKLIKTLNHKKSLSAMSGKFDMSKLKRSNEGEETEEKKYEGSRERRGGVEREESLMDRRGESREAGNLCSTLKQVTGDDCKMKLRDS